MSFSLTQNIRRLKQVLACITVTLPTNTEEIYAKAKSKRSLLTTKREVLEVECSCYIYMLTHINARSQTRTHARLQSSCGQVRRRLLGTDFRVSAVRPSEIVSQGDFFFFFFVVHGGEL